MHSMAHALYNTSCSTHLPCPMGCTTVHIPHGSCVVQHHTLHYPWGVQQYRNPNGTETHGPWVVQQYKNPMVHEPHTSLNSTWLMGCTTVQKPMHHGLCNSIYTPWSMDRTTPHVAHISHAPWVAQWYIYPIAHGLCNSTPSSCIMDCTMACAQYIDLP